MILDNVDLIHKMEFLTDNPILLSLRKAISMHPNNDWDDALSWGQLRSKKWLIQELINLDMDLGTIFLVGGWFGILPLLMFNEQELQIGLFRSFDIDPRCAPIADRINKEYEMKNWKFKASTYDMFDIDYNEFTYITNKSDGLIGELTETPNTIINTSCEHIDLEKWIGLIPFGKLVVLQSNNFFEGKDHINCVNNVDELISKSKLTSILFKGKLELKDYTRFMVIGIK